MRKLASVFALALSIAVVSPGIASAEPRPRPEPTVYCGPFVPLPGSQVCKAKLKGFG